MALICNGYRFGHMPHKCLGSLTTIYNGMGFRDMHLPGRNRNITAGQGITDDKVGIPMGYRHGGAWIMPQKPGQLSSHNNVLGLATCSATPFWTMHGTADGTSSCSATGYVVAQGSGTAVGTSTASGSLGAYAWCAGTADGSSTATLNSYATGALSGHIYCNESEATVVQIVDGVLDAMLEDHDVPGSVGEGIGAAGTAGDPWIGSLADYDDASQFGGYMRKLLTTAKFIALK